MSYRLQVILSLTIFSLAVTARLVPGPRTIDDSYITYRYARNILAGNGFVYNPGERVLGTTTPLYTLLLTIIGFFCGGVEAPFPQIATIVNAIADGITCLLLIKLGKLFKADFAGIGTALVWSIAPFSVTFAIGGLETSVYILFLVGAVYTHLRSMHRASAFLAALALLTRPDALILIGPVGIERVWQIMREKNKNLKAILQEGAAFVLPVSAWVCFAYLYFGTPIAHSILAKSLAYRLSPESGFIRLLQHYATPFLGHLTFGNQWIKVGLVLYIFLFLMGARHISKVKSHSWPFIAYPWLYFITFAAANPLIFRWYLTPPLPVYMLVILIGTENFLRQITNQISVFIQRLKKTDINKGHLLRLPLILIACFVILVPVFFSLRDWTLKPDHGLNRPAPNMAWYKLEILYKKASDFILADDQNSLRNPPILAAGDVGVLGFYTNYRILDTVGLNSLQSTQYYPLDPKYYVINYAIPPDLILDEEPDYVVILEVYAREGLLMEPRFWQSYSLISTLPTDIYGSRGMLIFKRKV